MSPFLDDRGRLFGKVSVVDLFVVVLLLAAALFGYVRFAGGDSDPERFRLTLVVERLRDANMVQFKAGDLAKDDGGTELGDVVSVSIQPTITEVPTADGRLMSAESIVYSDVVIVIEGMGRASSSTISAGSVPLRVGRNITLIGPGYEVRGQIRGVELIGE